MNTKPFVAKVTTTVQLSEDNIKEAIQYWLKEKWNTEVDSVKLNVKEVHDHYLNCANTCIGYEVTAKGE